MTDNKNKFHVGDQVRFDDREGKIVYMKDDEVVIYCDLGRKPNLFTTELRFVESKPWTKSELFNEIIKGEVGYPFDDGRELATKEFVMWVVTVYTLCKDWDCELFPLGNVVNEELVNSSRFDDVLDSSFTFRCNQEYEEILKNYGFEE